MIDPFCEKVKNGELDAEDFGGFLHHVSLCNDCIRRIYSRMVVESKQRIKGDQ